MNLKTLSAQLATYCAEDRQQGQELWLEVLQTLTVEQARALTRSITEGHPVGDAAQKGLLRLSLPSGLGEK